MKSEVTLYDLCKKEGRLGSSCSDLPICQTSIKCFFQSERKLYTEFYDITKNKTIVEEKPICLYHLRIDHPDLMIYVKEDKKNGK